MLDLEIMPVSPLLTPDVMPTVATAGSAGMDLYFLEEVVVYPQARKENQLIGMGFVLANIPEGCAAIVLPRSSNKTVKLTNVVGLIDSDYTGELMMRMETTKQGVVRFKKGDSAFQLVIVPIIPVRSISTVDSLDKETARGDGGFGSTTGKDAAVSVQEASEVSVAIQNDTPMINVDNEAGPETQSRRKLPKQYNR